MIIVDTEIYGNHEEKLLKAFLHGHIHGAYKLYRDLDTGKISIGFECGEDATTFKLKSLDDVFNREFSRNDDPFGSLPANPATYAPNAHTHLGTTTTTTTARNTKG